MTYYDTHSSLSFRLLNKNYWRRLRNNVTKFEAPGNRAPLKNLENINQFPYIIQPGNVFFMHMILMDSVNELEMNLRETYLVTENGNERLY